jgi:hypothetical protein
MLSWAIIALPEESWPVTTRRKGVVIVFEGRRGNWEETCWRRWDIVGKDIGGLYRRRTMGD